jgi:hypothetical protein
MLKKTAIIAAVVALVAVGTVAVMGGAGDVAACDGKTKTASAQAPACTKTASAAKVSAASAGTSSCTKTKTASAASTCSETAQAACCAKMAKQAHYTQVKKTADNIPYRVNTRVVMTGVYTCGSCDLGATDKCQAFLKTADGLYPLTHNKNVKAMYKLHKSGEKDFEITARVTKQGGAKYLDVTYYSAM